MGGGKMVIREPKVFPMEEGRRLGLGLLLPSSSPFPPSVSTDAVESLSAGFGTMTIGEGPEENSDGTGIPRGDTGWDEYVQPSGWDEDLQVQPSGWKDDAKPEKDSAPAVVTRKEGKSEQVQYPQRPGEPDCSFYLKTGSCRFGANCRFNHPPRRKRNKGKSKPNQTGNYEVPVVPNMEELGLGLPAPSCSSHDAASAEAFSGESKNLLQEEKLDIGGDLEYPGSEKNANLKDSMSSKEGKSDSFHFPQRPDKPYCSFYLKTGNCQYGSNCKFNHPPRAKERKVKAKKQSEPIQVAKEKESKRSTEKQGRAEGKYYSMPGVSKFGKSSKHTPLQENTEPSPVELNFLGLPLRPGERECPYYMRSGGCKFATNCRYHHPDPSVVGGQDTLSGFQNGASPQHYPSGATAMQMTSWPLPMASNEPVPLFDASPSYSSGFSPLPPQGFYPNPEWHGYQVPVTPWLLPDMSRTDVSHQPVLFDEYPERPGQKECDYFMKNGTCKFKSACRFHHPKTRLQKWA